MVCKAISYLDTGSLGEGCGEIPEPVTVRPDSIFLSSSSSFWASSSSKETDFRLSCLWWWWGMSEEHVTEKHQLQYYGFFLD